MRGKVLAIAGIAMLLACAGSARALPRFALMTGAKCASCHVNPTGGQMRTDYGLTFGMEKLPMMMSTSDTAGDDAFTFNPKLSENVSIGADYRSQFLYDQESQTSSFHMMTMSLYGSIRLQKKLTFSFKQDLANPGYSNLSGPELFLLAKVLPGGWYIKGGDFLPDYGWRLDDHTAYVRGGDLGTLPGYPKYVQRGLFFLPDYKDIGFEVGGPAGPLLITAGVFNGTGNVAKLYFEKGKAVVAKIEYSGGGGADALNYRIGVSGYSFRSYKLGGVHAGLGTADFALLGEIDFTHNSLSPYDLPAASAVDPDGRSMAAYGELDVRATQGVWLTGKYDVFDPARGVTGDALKRVTVGLELFPLPFVEVRPQYRIAMETPSVDNNTGLVQMHVWF
jgi:hypothetical protein